MKPQRSLSETLAVPSEAGGLAKSLKTYQWHAETIKTGKEVPWEHPRYSKTQSETYESQLSSLSTEITVKAGNQRSLASHIFGGWNAPSFSQILQLSYMKASESNTKIVRFKTIYLLISKIRDEWIDDAQKANTWLILIISHGCKYKSHI